MLPPPLPPPLPRLTPTQDRGPATQMLDHLRAQGDFAAASATPSAAATAATATAAAAAAAAAAPIAATTAAASPLPLPRLTATQDRGAATQMHITDAPMDGNASIDGDTSMDLFPSPPPSSPYNADVPIGCRASAILEGRLIIDQHSIALAPPCVHCGATRLQRERPGLCCANGLVDVPAWPAPPAAIREALQDLRDHTRVVNNLFAFSSLQGNKAADGFQPTVLLSGEVYACVQAIEQSAEPTTSGFAQLYIYDPAVALARRRDLFSTLHAEGLAERQTALRIIHAVDTALRACNPFVRSIRRSFDRPMAGGAQLELAFDSAPDNAHARTYNAPDAESELSIIYEDANLGDAAMVFQHNDDSGRWTRIHPYSPYFDAFRYPLLLPYGTPQWQPRLAKANGRGQISPIQYAAFLISHCDLLLNAGRLFQEWCCVQFWKAESQRLQFVRFNQTSLRADLYKR